MKQTGQWMASARLVIISVLAASLWAGAARAQQFNRIGYTVEIAQSYSPTAAAALGGEQNCQVAMLNSCAGANVVQQNSGTGAYWHIAGYHMSANDPGNVDGSTTLSWLSGNAAAQDVRDFASSIGADLLDYVATANNVSGIAYQPGYYSVLSYASGAWYVVFAHELGHNFGCPHADGLGAGGFRTIMLHNYCSGWDLNFYTNPSLYYNGIQLLGTTAQNCGTGSLGNNGNNAGIVAIAAPGKQNTGTRPASTNTANAIFDWVFTNAPGAVVAGTTVLDQSGQPLTVIGNGAMFTGTGLRLPGGTNGNVAANSIAAYLDLSNGIISSLTNLTVEIWATPISGKSLERLFSFGQMSGPGDGLGATGEWTGASGTPPPGNTTAVDELGLALADAGGSLAAEIFYAVTNSVSTNRTISASTAAGTLHYYAITFQDGAGVYGTNGGRITCYRDDDGNPTAYLDVNFHLQNLHDVNNWLGRSQVSSNAMANVEYSEVRISNVALTPQQIYGNYLLGGGNARTIFNPLLTAVHCGGAAVGTTNADQRTFAADQNYSGGNAWNANGYSYTVNVSGVTDPAPQTAYQDQRYGNMTYTFTNFQPGTNYLVRLHCMECCWSASGQRVFNVFINGVKVLSNFDIYATAGAQNKAVIREITTTANANGKIAVQFVNVVDNASISAIEILQGGLFAPVNLSALPGNGQVSLSWNAVTGAASYNVKRATLSGGLYTTVGTATATNYTDNPVAGTTTYYYVVSAVNGGNESFDSAEAGATTPVTVNTDTWVGGSGNNFSPVANWTYSIGAGPITNSDALVFDSVGSTTPNNDLTGFNISTLTFNPGAQAYTIGGNAFTLGTNGVSPVIAVNSANSQTINNNITLINANSTVSTASGNLKLGGVVSGTASLTKIGGQTLTLSGNNSFTGATAVSGGTLAITAGTFAPASLFAVGNTTGGNAVLNISGGSVAANYNSGQFNSSLVVGSASGSAGDVKFGGSTFSVNQQFGLGAGNGGYGAFEMSGGTATMGSFVVVGFNTDNSVLNLRGGSLTINNNLMTIAAGGSSSMGVVNLSGGTFNSIATTGYSPTIGGTFVGENGAGTLNVSGTALVNLSGWGLRMGHNSGANGTVNLLGGTVATTAVSRGSGTATLNFNGGTLKARAANPSFLTGLTAAYVYGGGANVNDGGFAITVGQPLLAPTGYGVASIAISNGGSGYIAPPVIKLTGGAGSGATAMAQIDNTLGTVTNILVTSPGVNYLNTDALTVALAGGGGSGAGGQAVLAANTSGGLTKVGGSTLTLTNVSTYAGRTTIGAGTLLLSGNGSIANSTGIMVGSGAGFNVSSVTGGYTLGAAQTLLGNGTVTGIVTVNGTVAPGASAASLGTLTFNSAPVLNGNLLMKISRTNAQTADKITLTSGTLRFGGTLLVTNLAGALAAGDSFKLFSAGSYSGAFASLSPATPGQGLVWNTNTLAVDGTLLVAAAAPPVIGSFAQSGDGFLLMSIAGGPPGSPYRVLASTNLVLPLTNWTPVWTDTFNLDGSGQFTNPAGPANAQQFFNIAVP